MTQMINKYLRNIKCCKPVTNYFHRFCTHSDSILVSVYVIPFTFWGYSGRMVISLGKSHSRQMSCYYHIKCHGYFVTRKRIRWGLNQVVHVQVVGDGWTKPMAARKFFILTHFLQTALSHSCHLCQLASPLERVSPI